MTGCANPVPSHVLAESFRHREDAAQIGPLAPPLGFESVLTYRPGGTSAAIAAVLRTVRGSCRTEFRVLSVSLGGTAPLLLESTDPGTVGAQQAHGRVLDYGLEARGDRLAWITVIATTVTTSQPAAVARLVRTAAQRMCTTSTC